MRKIEILTENDLEDKLCDCLSRHELPDCFLYVGPTGAESWINLDHSEEFPFASTLENLLRRNLPPIAERLPPGVGLLSLGVGEGRKERLLLAEFSRDRTVCYVAVDVSSHLVDLALEAVGDLNVAAVGVVAMTEDLPLFRVRWHSPLLISLLGNNFSNYPPARILDLIRDQMGPDDHFLFDCHVLPGEVGKRESWRRSVERIYGSGLNARLNLAPLTRHGAIPDSCDFSLDLMTEPSEQGPPMRTRKGVRVLKNQTLFLHGDISPLRAGEIIEMGLTCKYTPDQVQALLRAHRFETVRRFLNFEGDSMLVLARPV